PALSGRAVRRPHVHSRLGELAQHLRRGARPVLPLDEERLLARREHQTRGLGGAGERVAILGDEIELRLAARGRKGGEVRQVDSRFAAWRMTWKSPATPFAPSTARDRRAASRAIRQLLRFSRLVCTGWSFPASFSRA